MTEPAPGLGGVANTPPYDAVIVGGGPAGLTAAIYLGRFRRRSLVIDGGESRLGWIPITHNHPGFPDGVAGAKLLAAMKAQARRYGASIRAGSVSAIRRVEGGFAVEVDGERIGAPFVILATGAKDTPPPLPDLFDAVQKGLVRVCPICDAYEVIGKAIGVIGDGPHGAREALFLADYSDKVSLIHLGHAAHLDAAARAALAAAWDDGAPQTPALVKALAGRTARTAARHCQQVLAGMGFTTEHPLHRYVRRVLVLDEGRIIASGTHEARSARVRRDEAMSSSRPVPIGTTRIDTSVTPASAKECRRFSMRASLPAARMSPTFRASPCSSSF